MNCLSKAILFRDFDFSRVYNVEIAEMVERDPIYRFNQAERWGNKLFTSLVISLEISQSEWAQNRCFLTRQGLKVVTLFALIFTCWLWIPGYVLKKCGEWKNECGAARSQGVEDFGKWFAVTCQIGKRGALVEQLNGHLTSWGNWFQTRNAQVGHNLGQLIFGVPSTYEQAFHFGVCLANCTVAQIEGNLEEAISAFENNQNVNQNKGFTHLREQYIPLIRDARASRLFGLQYNQLLPEAPAQLV